MRVTSGPGSSQAETHMATYGGITFAGKSGEKYYFHAWPLKTRFKSVAAVFFVTKRNFSNKTYRIAGHEGIFIGQTASLSDPLATPILLERFMKHGANCICVLPIADAERRLAVEQDLMAAHNTSCNESRGYRSRLQAETEF